MSLNPEKVWRRLPSVKFAYYPRQIVPFPFQKISRSNSIGVVLSAKCQEECKPTKQKVIRNLKRAFGKYISFRQSYDGTTKAFAYSHFSLINCADIYFSLCISKWLTRCEHQDVSLESPFGQLNGKSSQASTIQLEKYILPFSLTC